MRVTTPSTTNVDVISAKAAYLTRCVRIMASASPHLPTYQRRTAAYALRAPQRITNAPRTHLYLPLYRPMAALIYLRDLSKHARIPSYRGGLYIGRMSSCGILTYGQLCWRWTSHKRRHSSRLYRTRTPRAQAGLFARTNACRISGLQYARTAAVGAKPSRHRHSSAFSFIIAHPTPTPSPQEDWQMTAPVWA